MSIRNKILIYFSVVTVTLVAVALFFIYTLFSQYREQDFQNRQKAKIETTLEFLTEIRDIDDDLIEAMDRITINDLYDEKLLIFDKNKDLVYSSIDDTPITFSRRMVNELSSDNTWIEDKDGLYDVVGVYLQREDKAYYGISKAYDDVGYSKLNYLKYVLLFTLLGISVVVILVAYYLSKKITQSIFSITNQIKEFNFEDRKNHIVASNTNDEIAVLAQRFNELMQRMNEAFAFQKHAVHHISHELKTPIAVLVSEFERIENETDLKKIKTLVQVQKENTKSLSEIINSLLEISKTESGNVPEKARIRIDELIYDLMDEFAVLYPEFRFSIEYLDNQVSENDLTVMANNRLLKAALSNLMVNCIQYSDDNRARINISKESTRLRIDFVNRGSILNEKERQFLFQHFFRGENSKGKKGFGLGLVFISKILQMYKGSVIYDNDHVDTNTFTIFFPLR